MISKPTKEEYNQFYQGYIDCVFDQEDILDFLETHRVEMRAYFEGIPDDKLDYAYAAGKWTIKEVLRHMIDTERILANRILRVARGEKVDLPGFEQDDYLMEANDEKNSWSHLIEDFDLLRRSNIMMVRGLHSDTFQRVGSASGFPTSVRALIHIMAGHATHHMRVLQEKYR